MTKTYKNIFFTLFTSIFLFAGIPQLTGLSANPVPGNGGDSDLYVVGDTTRSVSDGEIVSYPDSLIIENVTFKRPVDGKLKLRIRNLPTGMYDLWIQTFSGDTLFTDRGLHRSGNFKLIIPAQNWPEGFALIRFNLEGRVLQEKFMIRHR